MVDELPPVLSGVGTTDSVPRVNEHEPTSPSVDFEGQEMLLEPGTSTINDESNSALFCGAGDPKELQAEPRDSRDRTGIVSRQLITPQQQQQLGISTCSRKSLEQKISILEATIATQKKEIILLQRQLQSRSTGATDHRLANALKEIAALKEALNHANGKAESEREPAALQMQATIERLSTERNELMNCLRKQNKLIEALKRQKVHLESATLLNIMEKEIEKYFELAR
ncbi:uncharacterized protein TEOVI_000908200 [Trypanosoma equiperdum]|uniref:Uncharacterized protein n=3 Tax=Trypanozoon TaxID=39700 RepID=Q382X9_TRYB2|nr:hypothetical protein, conserved [Trypanosoma brucei brucei TREU927]EAN80152.1 hypothetical protein, conserved [Trypanosoma brucei brucei TREU927]RHW68119.1 hypothetical protein DPX39_110097700 [Trypanosoma brucei equiperdum]SCU67811.1 hypothetical protein, conserved [Trypanosoma equiperdum]